MRFSGLTPIAHRRSKRPMKHRKLRIAWSVAWGIAAVMLIALWVRSYWWRDFKVLYLPNNRWVSWAMA